MTPEAVPVNSTPLDSIRCPLTGCCLVEAAAGTGKTYSIQNLTARLVMEANLPIAAILVVTFTDAAATELRDRIRQILQLLQLRIQGGEVPAREEERTRLLLDQTRTCGVTDGQIRERLILALRDFDDATISTIHGFCQKVLSEFAFESGVLFSCRLEPDLEALYNEAGMDFYRGLVYQEEDAGLVSELFAFHGITVPALLKMARKFMERPGLQARTPRGERPDSNYYLARIRECLQELRRVYESGLPENWDGMLNKGYERADLAACIEELTPFFAGAPLPGRGWSMLARLHPDRFREKLKRTGKGDEKAARAERAEALLHRPFFQTLEQLFAEVDSYRIALQLEAIVHIGERVEELKRRHQVQSFHDLLLRVHQGLYDETASLTEALRRRYRAGIVDEFQDTDPIQYEIFARIFAADPEVPWFMVGDPRQAIYSFRGGDIATYRRADREREARGGAKRTLTTNYRSAPPMIEAVNEIFAGHACPFADPAIRFEAIRAPGTAETPVVGDGGALEIYYNPELNVDAMLTECVNRCFEALHDRTIQLPERAEPGVRPGDIAILVPASYMGLTLQERLNRLGIPAVFTRTGNIFASAEAAELRTLLEAVLAPSRGDLVVRALATAVGGCDLEELIRLQQDGVELAERQERFRTLSQLWHRRSFIEMFQTMLREFEVLARFPRFDTGERQLTNLLQLGDLLQRESRRRELSPRSLLYFLGQAIVDSAESQPEEYEQLLETDRAAVKIMTVHASKGLEFPLVFLPAQFAWHAEDDSRLDVYHNEAGGVEYDLGADPEARSRYRNERLQELLRLAYVAVTRAKYRCTIFWGKHGRGRGDRSSAWDWLFRMRDQPYTGDCLGDLLQCEREPEIPARYRIGAAPVPPPGARYRVIADHELRLELPELELQLDSGWQITSYSGLTRNAMAPTEDYDENDDDSAEPTPPATPEADIFAFPGGTQTGSAWHKILEAVDFTAASEEWTPPVRQILDEFGLRAGRDGAWREERTLRLLDDVLHTPLVPPGLESWNLAAIPRARRLSELEFHYGIRHGFTQRELRQLTSDYARERFNVATANWSAPDLTGGYLNGIIDLIFEADDRYYIADWKSNRLGARWSNFEAAMLPAVMGKSGYVLQYLLYSVALVKYLRLRLGAWDETIYERHFGGVWYLFLRGMSPETPGRGVFFDRPPYGLLLRLEELVG